MDIAAIHVQLVGNLVVGHIQSYEIQTQRSHFQGLMISRKNGVGQIIKACVTVVTLIALTCGFRIIKAAFDDLFGLTRGALDPV